MKNEMPVRGYLNSAEIDSLGDGILYIVFNDPISSEHIKKNHLNALAELMEIEFGLKFVLECISSDEFAKKHGALFGEPDADEEGLNKFINDFGSIAEIE